MTRQPDGIERRFQRLRTVVSAWEIRYNQLPDQVLSLFDASDLDSISELMREKRRLAGLISGLHEFIRRWELEGSEHSLFTSTGAYGPEE